MISLQNKYESGFELSVGELEILEEALCQKVEFLDESFYALENLFREKSQTANINLFNVIINASSNSNEIDRSFHTFQSIQKFNLKPNLQTFHGLLQVKKKKKKKDRKRQKNQKINK